MNKKWALLQLGLHSSTQYILIHIQLPFQMYLPNRHISVKFLSMEWDVHVQVDIYSVDAKHEKPIIHPVILCSRFQVHSILRSGEWNTQHMPETLYTGRPNPVASICVVFKFLTAKVVPNHQKKILIKKILTKKND